MVTVGVVGSENVAHGSARRALESVFSIFGTLGMEILSLEIAHASRRGEAKRGRKGRREACLPGGEAITRPESVTQGGRDEKSEYDRRECVHCH